MRPWGRGAPSEAAPRRAPSLDLNGHSISGGYIGVATDPGQTGRNEISGPGEIFGVTSGEPFGAAIAAAGKVVVRNVAGAGIGLPTFLGLLVEALTAAGRREEALGVLADAPAMSKAMADLDREDPGSP